MTDPCAWMVGQLIDAKPRKIEHGMVTKARNELSDVLDFIKSVRRPVTWLDLSDHFSRSRRWSQRKLYSLRGQLHVTQPDFRLGLPARYEWRGK